jgi:histone deacetylase 6
LLNSTAVVFDTVSFAASMATSLAQQNRVLQHACHTFLQARGSDASDRLPPGAGGGAEGDEARSFQELVARFSRAREALEAVRANQDAEVSKLQERLRELSQQGAKITEGLREFKLEVAKSAVNSRTGRSIPRKQIDAFLEEDEEKIRQIASVRIKGVNLRSAARKIKQKVHGREQLAEGLHLIDFEQLKIENQTLSEKIEERNEELQKLRRKTRNTVQELTHVKEKMQFVEIQVAVFQSEKETIEEELNHERDVLTTLKRERDELREDSGSAQQQGGFVDNAALIADYEQRQQHIAALREKLEELKAAHARLRSETQRLS